MCGLRKRSSVATNRMRSESPGYTNLVLSPTGGCLRSEEHTSELQSRLHLVCRLLLEKKKTTHDNIITTNTLVLQLTTATNLIITNFVNTSTITSLVLHVHLHHITSNINSPYARARRE